MLGGIILPGVAVAAALGWALFVYTYYLLRAWHRRASGARIAVYYKRRAALEAPITDWMTWCHTLEGDEAARGRVVYRGSHVSVVILRPGARPPTEVT